MKFLAPLIIVIILIVFGAWFCSGKPEEKAPVPKPAANAANNAKITNANTASNNAPGAGNSNVTNAPLNANR